MQIPTDKGMKINHPKKPMNFWPALGPSGFVIDEIVCAIKEKDENRKRSLSSRGYFQVLF